MLNKKIKPFISGLIIGGLLATTNIAIANNPIDIFINGEKINDNGIIVNNQTYVPLRVIGENLDYDVQWDSVNNKINITETSINDQEMTINKKLRIDSISKTTYKPIKDDKEYKLAFVTITVTNTSNEYVRYIKPKPILDNYDIRNSNNSNIWTNKYYLRELSKHITDDGLIPPNKTVSLTFCSTILKNTNVVNWII